ncbi:MAG: hypothetical protein M3O35_01295 [Acidobacteriota bacterium]|nr:hypothetical protein [Acidobacteriota bacterium]
MTRFEWCLIALFAAIIVFQSFVPPTVGLANNGDFSKMIGRFSLGPEEAGTDESAFYVQRWKYDPAYSWDSSDNTSSELLLIRAALGIVKLFSSRIFDIRILGVIHAMLWIGCFAASLPLFRTLPGWTRYAVPVFTVFVFSDVSYVAYFNSFYTDTAAFLFMRWCVVIALLVASRIWTGWLPFLGLLAAALFVIFSKPQHSLLGLLLWLLAAGVSLALPGRSGKIAGLILAPLLPLAAIIGVQMIPDGERQDGLFNMIFAKTLKHSVDLAADLRELGLSPDLQLLVGSYAQKEGSPMKDPNFARAFSRRQHQRLALFLLHHPLVSFGILYEDLNRPAAGRRLGFLGNYQREAGFPAFKRARSFGWWSAFRSFWFRLAPWHILVWYAGFIGASAWAAWRYGGTVAGNTAGVALVVATMGLAAMTIASFGEVGETDRHQWLFHVLTDITVVMAVAGGCRFFVAPQQGRLESGPQVANLPH